MAKQDTRDLIFISYTRGKPWTRIAEQFHDVLVSNYGESLKVRVFLDRKSISPGEDWQKECRENVDKSAYFVAIFCDKYPTSDPCKDEYDRAETRRKAGERIKTFVIRGENIDVEHFRVPVTVESGSDDDARHRVYLGPYDSNGKLAFLDWQPGHEHALSEQLHEMGRSLSKVIASDKAAPNATIQCPNDPHPEERSPTSPGPAPLADHAEQPLPPGGSAAPPARRRATDAVPPSPQGKKDGFRALFFLLARSLVMISALTMVGSVPLDTATEDEAPRVRLRDRPKIIFYGSRKNDPHGFGLDTELAKRFQQDTGTEVVLDPPGDRDRLWAIKRFFPPPNQWSEEATRSKVKKNIDLALVDWIWVRELAAGSAELGKAFEEEFERDDPRLVDINKVDGRIVSVPAFREIGVLYYRSDLLENYANKLPRGNNPPRTWDELHKAAWTIQQGQQNEQGMGDFRGFVWQTASYEGLTCNALEWIASRGGADKNGKIDLNHPAVRDALEQAWEWLHGDQPISFAADGAGLDENSSMDLFLNGKAAFLRGWTGAYPQMSKEKWPRTWTFGIAPLPTENTSDSVGALGGWDYVIPRTSRNQAWSAEFLRYLASEAVTDWRTKRGAFLPPGPTEKARKAYPEFDKAGIWDVKRLIRISSDPNAYQAASKCFYEAVHQALTEKSKSDVPKHIEDIKACKLGGEISERRDDRGSRRPK